MFTKNMIKFYESLDFLANEHGYLTSFTADNSTKFASMTFLNENGQELGHVAVTFDVINKTETPGHLALKLFNQMEESIK